MSRFPMITCKKCGTVHFEVSRSYAETEVKTSTEFLNGLKKEDRMMYEAGDPSIKRYEKCWCGSSYRNMRDYKEGDCPDGVTLGPMIKRSE